MADDRIAVLEERVRLLEAGRRSSRIRRGLGALVLVLLGASAALGVARAQESSQKESVEAREFIIRDDAGRILFYVGPEGDGVVLIMRDHSGKVTARLPPTIQVIPLTPR